MLYDVYDAVKGMGKLSRQGCRTAQSSRKERFLGSASLRDRRVSVSFVVGFVVQGVRVLKDGQNPRRSWTSKPGAVVRLTQFGIPEGAV